MIKQILAGLKMFEYYDANEIITICKRIRQGSSKFQRDEAKYKIK